MSITLTEVTIPTRSSNNPPPSRCPPGWYCTVMFNRELNLPTEIDIPLGSEGSLSSLDVEVGIDRDPLVKSFATGENVDMFAQARDDKPVDEPTEDFCLLVTHWLVDVALEDRTNPMTSSLEMLTCVHPWLIYE